MNIARLPLRRLPDALRHDGSPPLYYAMSHVWMRVFGTGDIAVRALPGLLGVITIPLAYLCGGRLRSGGKAFDRRARGHHDARGRDVAVGDPLLDREPHVLARDRARAARRPRVHARDAVADAGAARRRRVGHGRARCTRPIGRSSCWRSSVPCSSCGASGRADRARNRGPPDPSRSRPAACCSFRGSRSSSRNSGTPVRRGVPGRSPIAFVTTITQFGGSNYWAGRVRHRAAGGDGDRRRVRLGDPERVTAGATPAGTSRVRIVFTIGAATLIARCRRGDAVEHRVPSSLRRGGVPVRRARRRVGAARTAGSRRRRVGDRRVRSRGRAALDHDGTHRVGRCRVGDQREGARRGRRRVLPRSGRAGDRRASSTNRSGCASRRSRPARARGS